MRERTVTVREGELLGPIDWSYDFASHGWDCGGSMNPAVLALALDCLAKLDAGLGRGETWEATTDGGWPRIGWGEVRAVGMYDGWPYWKPTPSVRIAGHFGASWSSAFMLHGVRRVREAIA